MDDPETAFEAARIDAVVAGAAALVTVGLALADQPPLQAVTPLFVYLAYRAGGYRVTEQPLPWVALTVVVGLVVVAV